MTTDPIITRRVVLAAGAATAGAAVLAACSSSGSAGDSSAAGGGSPSSAGDGSDHSADSLATLAEIPVGGAVSVKLPNGKPGIVARPTATTAVCFSAICTHEGCTVKPDKTKLSCPCHGSQFAADTGKVLQGPAPSPLPKVSVSVQDGKVVAG